MWPQLRVLIGNLLYARAVVTTRADAHCGGPQGSENTCRILHGDLDRLQDWFWTLVCFRACRERVANRMVDTSRWPQSSFRIRESVIWDIGVQLR
jgi:hypothetical protein